MRAANANPTRLARSASKVWRPAGECPDNSPVGRTAPFFKLRNMILPLAIHGVALSLMAGAEPTTQAAAVSLQLTVVEVSGNVQVRSGGGEPWRSVAIGMQLDEGAEFRTGPHSSVRCTIPPDQSFTLDRLGTVKVAQAIRNGNKLTTEMVMKYGRTKYSVEAAGLEHEGTISSPTATLAVRGTVVSLYDQPPFVPEAVSYMGKARFKDAHRQVNVGGKGAGTQTVTEDKDSPGETALYQGVIDPKVDEARTPSERRLIATEASSGGISSFSPYAPIPIQRGGAPITSEVNLARSLPGQLNFVARWFGHADVNLEVFVDLRTPLDALLKNVDHLHADEVLYPGFGMNHTASGGTIGYDHRGGPNGGTEIASWNRAPQHAIYGLGAGLISGKPVDLKLNAYYDGQKQYIYYTDASNHLVRTKTLDVMLTTVGISGSPRVYLPNVDSLLGTIAPTVGDGAPAPLPVGGGFGSGDGGSASSGNGDATAAAARSTVHPTLRRPSR
jgi:hypothetical protein